MQNCKAVSTPVDISTKLVKATIEDECADQQLYHLPLKVYCTYQLVQDLTSHML